MKLVPPSTLYQESYLQAIAEGKNELTDTRLSLPETGESFASFVQRLTDYAKGLQLPKGWVPSTELWLINNDKFIGRVSIRHTLNDHLLHVGGHIGYYIRPSQRNKGYGKILLQRALPIAKEIGIEKVLITCDDDNPGSQKIITANGGILESIIEVEKGKPKLRRYWIQLQ